MTAIDDWRTRRRIIEPLTAAPIFENRPCAAASRKCVRASTSMMIPYYPASRKAAGRPVRRRHGPFLWISEMSSAFGQLLPAAVSANPSLVRGAALAR